MWLASKLEECPRKARQVIIVFNRIECRRENLPIEYLDAYSKVKMKLRLKKINTFWSWLTVSWGFVSLNSERLSFFFSPQKYSDLKMELSRTERHILKEMGFICHVEHPHKFISNYLVTLGTPTELRQEAWNLANDRYFLGIFFLNCRKTLGNKTLS